MKTLINFTSILLLASFTFTTHCALSQEEFDHGPQKRIILIGDIVTMDNGMIIKNGKVIISGTRITGILDSNAEYDTTNSDIIIRTDGYIYPGFIDLHNHLPYNSSRFVPFKSKTDSRYKWQEFEDYKAWMKKIGQVKSDKNDKDVEKKINIYSEVKILTGGVTFSQGANRRLDQTHYPLLVRNAEFFHYNLYSNVFIYNRNNCNDGYDCEFNKWVVDAINDDKKNAYIFHLGEGYDKRNKYEFPKFNNNNLLNSKSVLAHCVGLNYKGFQTMTEKNSSMVWSPTSNLFLYGVSSHVDSAKMANVNICLGTDWSPSSPKNLLHEIKMAYLYNKNKLDSKFSNKELVDMITVNPSKAISMENHIGKIKNGYWADIVVLEKKDSDPYLSLIKSWETDVNLVMIGGSALLGNANSMHRIYNRGDKDLQIVQVRSGYRYIYNQSGVTSLGRYKSIEKFVERRCKKYGVDFDPIKADELYFLTIKKETGYDIQQLD